MPPYFVFFRMSSMLWLTSECLAFLLYKFCLLQNVLRVCSAVLAVLEEKNKQTLIQEAQCLQLYPTSYVVMAEHPEYSEFCPHCGFKIASTHHYFVVKHNTRLSQQQCFSQNSSALSGSHSPTCSRSMPSPAPPPRSPTRSPFASQTVFRVKAVCALGH